MKKLNLLLGLIALSSGAAHAKRTDTLSQARARYATVNREVPKLRVVTRDLSGYSAEGGALTAYLQRDTPRKLVARHYGESGQAREELYFWRGRLFFVHRINQKYEKPLGQEGAPGKFLPDGEERFYFSNGRLLRYVDAKNRIVENRAALEKHEAERLQFARELLAGLRSKSNIIIAPR